MTNPVRLASDSNVHRYTMAALSWLLQDHPAVAGSYVANLGREETLQAWHNVNALQALLAQRHAYLCEAAAVVADPVPAGVQGYPIGSRNQQHAARALPDVCPWCGKEPCPDRWTHERMDAASETTWRRA